MLKITSTAVADPEEERRGPGPTSVFWKDKDSTDTFNNKGQTAWNINLIIYLLDTCMPIAYWTMLPPISPDKSQSSLMFGSEKAKWIDKYRQRTKIKIYKSQ